METGVMHCSALTKNKTGIEAAKEKTESIASRDYRSLKENISYARYLQTRLFQDREIKDREQKNCFVLDLPKDIVSGDFGWMYENETRKIFIVGDCTGHGVSAAMLNMLMKNYLNLLIRKNSTDSPSGILKELNDYLFELNRCCSRFMPAGLDIGVCCIEKKQNQIQFCGANRPLYFMRNGELLVIKGSRYTMGSEQDCANRFLEICLESRKNDMLYLFSDGFCDQFGGMYNKKLMNNRLKNLLANMYWKPPGEQKAMLEKFFTLWKADTEQTDDVYVAGLLL